MQVEKVNTVIFRRFKTSKCQNPYHPNYAKGGEIVALFPYEIETKQGDVLSYMHIGQHSTASLDIIQDTVLAQPSEYADLQKELEGIGYVLDIRKRVNWKRWNEARKAI